MPHLDEPSTQTANEAGHRDALSSLYTMSTTSAPAKTEYAAINSPSVVTLLLGVAGVLALFTPILLLIPLAALLLGVVALVQINRSGGTQTGRGFAILGMVLAIGLGALVGFRAWQTEQAERRDERQIAQTIEQMGNKVAAGDYAGAYAFFTDRFRAEFSADRFEGIWKAFQGYADNGPLRSMRWNGRANFDSGINGVRASAVSFSMNFEKRGEPVDATMVMSFDNGRWLIDAIPDYFQPERAANRRRGASDPRGGS